MHRDPCTYGADIGLTRRTQGWLTERGLSLAQLDLRVAAHLPQPYRTVVATGGR
jgi:hypothetical protein